MRFDELASELRLLAVRDSRISEIRTQVSEALPLLVATNDPQTRNLSPRERKSLATLVGLGDALRKIQPDINRINKNLGQTVDALAKALQGK